MMSLKPFVVAACVVLAVAVGKAPRAEGANESEPPSAAGPATPSPAEDIRRLQDTWREDVVAHVRAALMSAGAPGHTDRDLTVLLEFTVNRIGKVQDCRVGDHSSSKMFDDYAVKTICILDMPPIPSALAADAFKFSLPIEWESAGSPEVASLAYGVGAMNKSLGAGPSEVIFWDHAPVDIHAARRLLRNWEADVTKLLRDATVYPPRARIARPSGTVVVDLTVEATGKIKDCTLASKSGSDTLDNYTMETICALEMPPIPEGLGIREIHLRVPQRFVFKQY
ncbi:MAG: TonB family protein [Zavarzinia sp.]|nr:TonB family protein [Zavarzinia sp.]